MTPPKSDPAEVGLLVSLVSLMTSVLLVNVNSAVAAIAEPELLPPTRLYVVTDAAEAAHAPKRAAIAATKRPDFNFMMYSHAKDNKKSHGTTQSTASTLTHKRSLVEFF